MSLQYSVLNLLLFSLALRYVQGLQSTRESIAALAEKLLLDKIHNEDLHRLNGTTHLIRNDFQKALSWENNYKAVTSTGHTWCGLNRDNWSCVGDHYEKVLRATAPFNQSFNPSSLRNGTKILLEGNSYLAELAFALVCPSSPMDLYVSMGRVNTNDLIAYYPESDVAIVLIANDVRFFHNRTLLPSLLIEHNFHPNYTALSSINLSDRHIMRRIYADMLHTYALVFPGTVFIPMYVPHLRWNCYADSRNCPEMHQPAKQGGGHQCIPGPILRDAEAFIGRIQYEEQFMELFSFEHKI